MEDLQVLLRRFWMSFRRFHILGEVNLRDSSQITMLDTKMHLLLV